MTMLIGAGIGLLLSSTTLCMSIRTTIYFLLKMVLPLVYRPAANTNALIFRPVISSQWNRRTKRFDWNPYGNEAYHSTAKINLLLNARLLFGAVGTHRHLPPGQVQESKGRDYRNYSNDLDWSAKGKNWHRPSSKKLYKRKDIQSELLPKSSIMGMKGEYDVDYLDQVLQHSYSCLIPFMGPEIQSVVLDAFALTKSSNELDEFCRTPL